MIVNVVIMGACISVLAEHQAQFHKEYTAIPYTKQLVGRRRLGSVEVFSRHGFESIFPECLAFCVGQVGKGLVAVGTARMSRR